MVLKLPWARKRMFCAFQKSTFGLFAKFWVTKVRPFCGKVRESVKICLNQILGIRIFLEKGFKATLSSKRMFKAFEKSFFQFFANLWVTKLKPFSGKVGQSIKIYWNQSFVTRTFLENVFVATLSSQTNVLSVWKEHFSVFWQFLSDKVETLSWESEAKCSKLFKSKFGHRKCLT